MVEVERINGKTLTINPLLVETIEEMPDTVLVFNSGRKLVVKDKKTDIESRFLEYMSRAVAIGINRSKK